MPSALHNGSTRQWRKLRAAMQAQLDDAGALPCWRCGRLIMPTDQWVLGHIVDRALGGDDTRLAPEHRRCSEASGARLANALRRSRSAQRMSGAQGELFGHADSDRRSGFLDAQITDTAHSVRSVSHDGQRIPQSGSDPSRFELFPPDAS